MTTLRAIFEHNQWANERLLEALREAAGDWVLPRYRTRFPSIYGS